MTATLAPAPQRRATRPVREIRPGDVEERWQIASSAVTIVLLVCAWMVLQMTVLSAVSEHRAQHLLYSDFRAQLAQAIVPTGELNNDGNPVVAGSPVALLQIPGIGLEQVVVDGTSSADLLNGPGHSRRTVMPGQVGGSVVFGRGATYGAPFRNLDKVHAGDQIIVTNASGVVPFKVLDVRHAGDPIPPFAPGAKNGRLVLVSADGHGFLGALRPGNAIYVDADTTAATPAGVVAPAVPKSEDMMARDTSGLPFLTLLLAILAALVLAVTIARRHLQAALVWTCATPVVMALAWAITDQVMRLLPNLM